MHYMFSTQGLYFVSASKDKFAKLWTTESTKPARIFIGHKNDVEVAIFHPNLHYVITGSWDYTIRMWAIGSGKCKRIFIVDEGPVRSLWVSRCGTYLFSGSKYLNLFNN